MSHFFGKILTVWGQLLSQYNSPGIKDQPQTGRLLPPTRGPCLWRHREGPRTASLWGVGGGSGLDFFFSWIPLRLRGVGSLENSVGFGQGSNGKPRILSHYISPDFFTRLAAGMAFLQMMARADSGCHQAWGPKAACRRAARRRALDSRGRRSRAPSLRDPGQGGVG